MNYTLIILGVILCVIIFMLYQFMNARGKVVTSTVTLNASTTNPSVPFSALSSPTSARYYLSFWLNVNSITGTTDVFKIATGAVDALVIKLSSASELQYTITSAASVSTSTHTILANFPLQKWVYVILSIDEQTVDIYIDGKMIRSEKLTAAPAVTTNLSVLSFVDKPTNAEMYIAKLERNPTTIDPSTAWSSYMGGNGGNYFSSMFSSYGANFTLTKDNLDVNKLSLF